MIDYLKKVIIEKGVSLDSEIQGLEHECYGDVHGVTWDHLIEFLEQMPEFYNEIRKTLVTIDFNNGDVFDYLKHLANGMVNAEGVVA